MKIKSNFASILLVILISSAVSTALAAERTFKVSKGGTLQVSLSGGDISISTWDRNEVKVTYEDGEEFQIEQRGNIIDIEDEGYFGGEDLDISIPSQFNVHVQTQSGDIRIMGTVTGNIEAGTSGGDIKLNEVIGMVDLKTAGGNITTGNIKGDAELNSAGGELVLGNIDGRAGLKTAGGNVVVKEVTRSIEVRTGGGNVSIGKVAGEIDISSGGGNISISSAGENVKITTGGGNIGINGGNGKVSLATGGGNIDLKNLKGSINASSGGGNVTVQINEVIGSSKLSTGMGDVKLYVPEKVKATVVIRLHHSWSTDLDENLDRIISDFQYYSAEKFEDEDVFTVTYKINGGGSKIEIDTGDGNVYLKKN